MVCFQSQSNREFSTNNTSPERIRRSLSLGDLPFSRAGAIFDNKKYFFNISPLAKTNAPLLGVQSLHSFVASESSFLDLRLPSRRSLSNVHSQELSSAVVKEIASVLMQVDYQSFTAETMSLSSEGVTPLPTSARAFLSAFMPKTAGMKLVPVDALKTTSYRDFLYLLMRAGYKKSNCRAILLELARLKILSTDSGVQDQKAEKQARQIVDSLMSQRYEKMFLLKHYFNGFELEGITSQEYCAVKEIWSVLAEAQEAVSHRFPYNFLNANCNVFSVLFVLSLYSFKHMNDGFERLYDGSLSFLKNVQNVKQGNANLKYGNYLNFSGMLAFVDEFTSSHALDQKITELCKQKGVDDQLAAQFLRKLRVLLSHLSQNKEEVKLKLSIKK